MKLFSTLALIGAASAACPPNSLIVSTPYVDMGSCQCDAGYQAYPAPGWGCQLVSATYPCPANSVATVATPTSFDDCACAAGYVANTDQCTFAYIFHVHGRIWLAPYTKAQFTQSKELALRNLMATTIDMPSVTYKDVLPYSIHEASSITTDLKDARLDHSKIVLGTDESGELGKNDGGLSIGFAVHEASTDMTLANQLVARMKTKLLPINALQSAFDQSGYPTITYCNVYLWALTGAFWQRPTKTSYTWAPTKAATPYPTLATAAPGPGTAAPTTGEFCKAQIEIVFYLRCDCPAASSTTAECLAPGFLTMHRFTAQNRAAFIIGLSNLFGGSASEDFSIKRVSPINRATDFANGNGNTATTWYNPESYNPIHSNGGLDDSSHSTWEGIAVKVGIKAYTMAEANTILAAAKSNTLSANLATQTAAQSLHLGSTGQCVQVQMDTINPVPCPGYEHSLPTPMPTAAPTPLQLMPGSQPHCDQGTVMEIKGVARLQAADELTDADAYMKQVRTCMTASAQVAGETTLQWCNMNVQNWVKTKFTIRAKTNPIAETGLHTMSDLKPSDFTDGADQIGSRRLAVADTCDGCNIYTYTFVFVLNVPGQNMHTGNKVFDQMHQSASNHAYLSAANGCIGGTAYVPPMLASTGNTFRPVVPVLESLNVSSIRYTYIAPALTSAPTPRATAEDSACDLSIWSGWTTCSVSCGIGTQSKFRVVLSAPAGTEVCAATHATRACSSETVHDGDATYPTACPVDCAIGAYGYNGVAGDWSPCTKSCGWGESSQTRTEVAASNSGVACPGLTTVSKQCNPIPCPVDCVVSDFSAWSTCNKRCGGGKMRKFRTITVTSYYYGKECPDLEEEADCNSQPCPTNCAVAAWSDWGTCSESCAGKAAGTRLSGAKQERTRYVTAPAAYGGHPCPALSQTKLCALHPCGATVCTTSTGFPLTCTYEGGIVYTHHVNDVHDNELFMCYHNYVTEVCTCLCWPKADITSGTHRQASTALHLSSNVATFVSAHNNNDGSATVGNDGTYGNGHTYVAPN
jgi:hypothetical protein